MNLKRQRLFLFLILPILINSVKGQNSTSLIEKNSPDAISQKYAGQQLITRFGGTYYAINEDYILSVLNMPTAKGNNDYYELVTYLEKYERLNADKGSKNSKIESSKISYYKKIALDSLLVFDANKTLLKQKQRILDDSTNLTVIQKKVVQKKVDDSIQNAYADLQKGFISPLFIFKNLGFFKKEKVNELFGDNFISHKGGVDYYDMNNYTIGLTFSDSGVCYKMAFRLFGDQALKYMDSLLDNGNGFKLVKKTETLNLELESDLSSQLLNGQLKIYKFKDVICEVFDGSYVSFTFYRTK
jgi:hypothetical protein